MKVLGFDCAGSGCSAAVLVAGAVAAQRAERMPRGQAAVLVPMIQAVLGEAKLKPADLDLIAVTTGPGGFTGLRIALATARGLGLASGVPVVGVTCFAAVAAGLDPFGGGLLVALESKRAELFLQRFGDAARGPALVPAAEWAGWLSPAPVRVAGDGAARLAAALALPAACLAAGDGVPAAPVVARLGAAAWQPGSHPPFPAPLYLRPADVTLPAGAR